jgi:hypothetical protein
VKALALIVFAACAPTAPPAEPRDITAPVPRPPVTVTCIPTTSGKITNAAADGTRVRYCLGETTQCFAIDPDVAEIGGFAHVEAVPPPPPPGAYVETTQPRVEVCSSAECTSLTEKVLGNAAQIRAATTSDGLFAAFLFGATTPKSYVEIWDVTTTKKVATIRKPSCDDVAMLGESVLLRCGTQSALFSRRGKKLADAGGKGFAFAAYVPLEGNQWAFLNDRGSKIAVQDVARGTVVKTIDTSGVFMIGGAQQGAPGESSLVKLGERLVVIAGAPALGSVAAIDPKTGAIELRQAPLCK